MEKEQLYELLDALSARVAQHRVDSVEAEPEMSRATLVWMDDAAEMMIKSLGSLMNTEQAGAAILLMADFMRGMVQRFDYTGIAVTSTLALVGSVMYEQGKLTRELATVELARPGICGECGLSIPGQCECEWL